MKSEKCLSTVNCTDTAISKVIHNITDNAYLSFLDQPQSDDANQYIPKPHEKDHQIINSLQVIDPFESDLDYSEEVAVPYPQNDSLYSTIGTSESKNQNLAVTTGEYVDYTETDEVGGKVVESEHSDLWHGKDSKHNLPEESVNLNVSISKTEVKEDIGLKGNASGIITDDGQHLIGNQSIMETETNVELEGHSEEINKDTNSENVSETEHKKVVQNTTKTNTLEIIHSQIELHTKSTSIPKPETLTEKNLFSVFNSSESEHVKVNDEHQENQKVNSQQSLVIEHMDNSDVSVERTNSSSVSEIPKKVTETGLNKLSSSTTKLPSKTLSVTINSTTAVPFITIPATRIETPESSTNLVDIETIKPTIPPSQNLENIDREEIKVSIGITHNTVYNDGKTSQHNKIPATTLKHSYVTPTISVKQSTSGFKMEAADSDNVKSVLSTRPTNKPINNPVKIQTVFTTSKTNKENETGAIEYIDNNEVSSRFDHEKLSSASKDGNVSSAVYIIPVVITLILCIGLVTTFLLYKKKKCYYRTVLNRTDMKKDGPTVLNNDLYTKVDFTKKKKDRLYCEETMPLTEFSERVNTQDICVSSTPTITLPTPITTNTTPTGIYSVAGLQSPGVITSSICETNPDIFSYSEASSSTQNQGISPNDPQDLIYDQVPGSEKVSTDNINLFDNTTDTTASSGGNVTNNNSVLVQNESPYSLRLYLPNQVSSQSQSQPRMQGVDVSAYLRPICHTHVSQGPNWRPFHPYDPVYVPVSNASAMNRLVDSTGYVSRPRRGDSPTIVYEEINYGQVKQFTHDLSNNSNNINNNISRDNPSIPPPIIPCGTKSTAMTPTRGQIHRTPPSVPRKITMGATASGGQTFQFSDDIASAITPQGFSESDTSCATNYTADNNYNTVYSQCVSDAIYSPVCDSDVGENTNSYSDRHNLNISIPKRTSQASSGTSREEMYEVVDFDDGDL